MPRGNPVINIGLSSDVEQFIKELKSELETLGNTGVDVGLADSFKKEIHEIENMLDGLQKTIRSVMGTKLNSATFGKYQQQIGKQIDDLEKRTSALEHNMSVLINTMSSADGGKISTAFTEAKNSIKEMGEAALDTLNAVKQVQEVAQNNASINIIDASQEKKELEDLISLLNTLTKSLDAMPKVDTFSNNEDAIKRLSALYHEFDRLSGSIQEFEYKDIISNDELRSLTLIQTKLADIANEFLTIAYNSEEAFGEDFSNAKIDGLSIDNIRLEFEDTLGEMEESTRKSVERINQSLSSIDVSVQNATISDKSILRDENKGLSVPLNVRTTDKGLLTSCLQILHKVQSKLEDSPLEVNLELTTAWGSKKNKEILKEFQNQINSLSSQTDISEFQQLYDKVATSFGNQIELTIGSNIDVVEKQIQQSIARLKAGLKKEPLNIDLTFKVDDANRIQLQNLLTKITSDVVVTIKNVKFAKELNVKDSIKRDIDALPIEQFDRIAEKLEEIRRESTPIINAIVEVRDLLSSLPTDRLLSDIGELVRLLQVGFNALSISELDNMFADLQERVSKISGSLRGANLTEIKDVLRAYKEYQSLGGNKPIIDLSDQKNIQNWFKKHYEDQNILQNELTETAQDIDKINQTLTEQDFTILVEPLNEVIRLIRLQIDAYREVENVVSTSVSNEISDLFRLSSTLEEIANQIRSIGDIKGFSSSWIKDLKKVKADDLNGAANALQQMHKVLQNLDVSDNNFIVQIQSILSKGQELSNLAKILAESKKKIESASKTIQTQSDTSRKSADELARSQSKLTERINNSISKGNKYIGDGFGDKYTIQFQNQIKETLQKFEVLQQRLEQPLDAKGIEAATQEAKELANELENRIAKKSLPAMKRATEDSINKAILKLDKFMDANSAMGKQFRAEFENLRLQISTAESVEDLKALQSQVIKLESEVIRAGKSGTEAFERLGQRIKQMSTNFIAMHLSLYDLWRYTKQAVDTIINLDTALVDLKKTTTMSNAELEEFYYNSSNIAKQTGATTQEIISQAAAWSRLGYSSKEAATSMAELSSRFAAISPGMSLDNATDGLVSTMQAFHVEVDDTERDIMDNVNRIGNTFATSNDEIMEMLKRSSAAMNAANNSLEETIALESAAVEITRNAETTGTAFRTISMRIRGYDEETEEFIGNVEQLSGDIAELTKTAKTPGGISLFTDANKTEYKSTYQLLKDISEVYDDLTDKQQAQLLEKLAGKRGGQVLAGIISNFSEVDRAMAEMQTAAGSAKDEMAIIEESIDFKINALKNTWVNTLQQMIDKGQIGQLVDGLTSISEALGWIIDKVGLLNLGGFGLEGFLMSKGLGFVNYDNKHGQVTGLLPDLFQLGKLPDYDENTLAFIRNVKEMGTELKASDIDNIARQMGDLDKNVISISRDMVGAEFNTKQYEKALIKTSSASKNLSSTLKVLGGVVASMAITFAIEKAIELTYALATSTQQLFKEAAQYGSEFKSIESDLDSYKTKITELQKKLSDSTMSYEDAKEARKQLMGIQSELISKYGSEEGAIRSITSAIDDQVDALDRLKDAEYLRLLGQFNDNSFSSFVEDPIKYIARWKDRAAYGLSDASDNGWEEVVLPSNSEMLQREMAHAMVDFHISDKDLATFKKNADKFKSIVVDDFGNVTGVGEIHDLKDDLSALFGVLEHSDISVRNLNKVSNEIHKLDTKINDGEEWSDYLTLRNSINGKDSSLNVESQYQSFIKAQEAYETAVVNGNKSMAEDLAIQMSEIYQNIYSKYGADNYLSGEERQVLNYFKRLSPEMSLEVAKFRNQLQKDLEFEPVVKANDIQIQDKEVLSEELSKYIREEINKATELGIDLSNTVYGNIDTTVRDRLEWTDENLEKFHDEILSWGISPEELKGSISTVLGSMDEFDGIEIAYSPMLETDHGLELLSQETVNAYINRVLETAGDNKSLDNILKIDAEGFEIQGKKVKNLIADVGETAEKTSQSMHFTGLNGSIESAANELAALDIELNKLYDSNESLTSAFDSSLTRRLQNAIAMSDITLETLNKMDDVVNQYGEDALKDFGYTEIEIRVYKALNEILEEYGITVSQATHSMHEMKLVSTDLQKQLRNSFNSNDVKDYISTLSEEDLAILLKAHLDEDATLSEVKHAIEKGQYYADSNPITLTTRVDVATSDVSESVEKAFDAIEASYKSLLDSEGKFTAGSIDFDTQKSLAEIFGDTSGFEKYIDVLSDVSATETEYQQAHDNLINNYINSQKFYDQVTESTANQVEAMLRAHNVTNAHEIVTEALNAKLAEEEARTQAVALADEYCAQAKTSLTEVSEKAEEQAYQDVYAFLEEKGASEETKYAITDLILATDAFSNTTIDISSKLNNLASLCSALGETELAAYAAAAAIESVGVAQAQAKAGATADERLGITAGAATESAGTKYASKDSAYRLATAKLKTKSSGQLHAGNIRNMKTDWGKAKQTALGGSGGKGSGGGGGGGGSKDPTEEAKKDEEELEDTYDEFFDYFERRLKVVSDAISLLDAHLENVVGSNAKNTLLDAQMRIYKMQQQEYADAQNMYQEMADRALAKIEDSNIVEKIKNGAVGIDEFIGKGNEEVVNAINDYTKWADKVADCKQQLAELKETIRQLELTRMKNILQDWQDVFDLRQDNAIDLIDKQISLIEESGNLVGKAFYEQQKRQTEGQLSAMEQAKRELSAELNRGLANGSIEVGTDEWIEEVGLLQEVESNILDCKQAIEEYDNAILAIHTDTFERLIDKFDDLDDELSDIAAFFDDEKVGDKFGNWSETGQAQAGLLAQQYELAQNKVKKYAEQIDWLNGQYNAGKYSTTEYTEQLAELMDAMRESAKDAESAKEAMLDLNKARVDIVIDGINEEIEAYSDLISKEKDALSAEKDLHDYRKQIAESNKSIVAIQKQLAAIENDNSQKARAQRAKLQQQLKDAQDALAEQEYDHSVEMQQQALDEQLEQYKDTRQKEIDELNAYVENSQQVLTDMFENVRANAESIGQTIVQTAQEHGFQVSTSLTESWKAGENAIASYGAVLTPATSEFIAQLENVEQQTWDLQDQADKTAVSLADMFGTRADTLVGELQRSWQAEANAQAMADALRQSMVYALESGYDISSVVSSLNSVANAAKDVAEAANDAAGALDNAISKQNAFNNMPKSSDLTHITTIYNNPNANQVNWDYIGGHTSLNSSKSSNSYSTTIPGLGKKTKKHARGLSKAEQDELAWTQELGSEFIVSPTRNSILTPIKAGDAVIDAKGTRNLFELAKIDPNDILQGSGAKVVAPQIESTNNSVSIGNLVNVEGSISSENLDAVKATIQSELKKTFRNINSGLRR